MRKISEDLLQEIQDCKKCNTINGYVKFPSDSHGKLDSKYVIVSEAPGDESVNMHKKYWMGAGGRILRSAIDEELETIFYLTDILKCWPDDNGKNRKPNENEVTNCSDFFKREMKELAPELIIALGKTISEFLLKKPVNLKDSHGKVFKVDNRKILILYHPSNIDFHMNRTTYIKQLKLLFKNLSRGISDLSTIKSIFNKDNQKDNSKKSKETQQLKKLKTIASFTFPAPGNSITNADIKSGKVRITVDFKNHFPTESRNVTVIFDNKKFDIPFRYRIGRSHVLTFGKELMGLLKLHAGDSLTFEMINQTIYRISTL